MPHLRMPCGVREPSSIDFENVYEKARSNPFDIRFCVFSCAVKSWKRQCGRLDPVTDVK